MPIINIDGPPTLNLDAKRSLAQALTDAAVAAYELPRDSIVVVIKENPTENVARGGQLIVDRNASPEG